MAQLSREYLERRLEQETRELSSGRTFLRAAGVVVLVNGLLVTYNLMRGWIGRDWYYAFILVVWTGFYVVQRLIVRRKEAEVERLRQAVGQ